VRLLSARNQKRRRAKGEKTTASEQQSAVEEARARRIPGEQMNELLFAH